MIKYIVAATLIGGFWFFAIASIAMMGGGPGATMKRSFWNFTGSFIAFQVIAGLLLFFWFYKKDSFFALFLLVSCLVSALYLVMDLKKDFLFFLSATPVVGNGLGDGFIITKDRVFFRNAVLEGLDPESFQLFTVMGKKYTSLGYVQDKNGVYEIDTNTSPIKIRLMSVDRKSFSVLDYGYSLDNNAVYYGENKLEGVDPQKFVVEGVNSGKYYDASDGIHMYKNGVLVKDPSL